MRTSSPSPWTFHCTAWIAHAVLPLALLPAAGGCGGSQAAAATTVVAPAPAPIPAEPLQLIPADAGQALRVDLTKLRGWSEYAKLATLVENSDCEHGPALVAFGERLDLVAAAGLPTDAADGSGGSGDEAVQHSRVGGLIVVRGRFEGLGLEAMIAQLSSMGDVRPGKTNPKITHSMRGRFEFATDGTWSMVKLDDHTVVAGDARAVLASIALAEDPAAPSLRDAPVLQQLEFAQRLLVGFAQPDTRATAELGRSAAQFGGPGVAAALEGSSTAFYADVSGGLVLETRTELTSPQLAGDLMGQIQRMTGQAAMFLRMFRLPPLQERLDTRIEDRTLILTLTLPPEEVARVSMLLQTTIEGPRCTPPPAQTPATPGPPGPPGKEAP